MSADETSGHPEVSPVIGFAVLDAQTFFWDTDHPCIVKLMFHADGAVSYERTIYGRHNAQDG